MKDEEVSTIDGVFEGAYGALGDKTWFRNGSSSGCHGCLWWLIMDEEDDEDEEVSTMDGVFEGAYGVLGDKTWFRNGSSSGCHGGLWWLIMDEEDAEVIVNIWREFIRIE
ncbi:hypothetical protein Tco_0336981 [Tanacetum coccineum]